VEEVGGIRTYTRQSTMCRECFSIYEGTTYDNFAYTKADASLDRFGRSWQEKYDTERQKSCEELGHSSLDIEHCVFDIDQFNRIPMDAYTSQENILNNIHKIITNSVLSRTDRTEDASAEELAVLTSENPFLKLKEIFDHRSWLWNKLGEIDRTDVRDEWVHNPLFSKDYTEIDPPLAFSKREDDYWKIYPESAHIVREKDVESQKPDTDDWHEHGPTQYVRYEIEGKFVHAVGTQGFKSTIYIPTPPEKRYGGGFTKDELVDNYGIGASWSDYKFQKIHGSQHYRRFRPTWIGAIMWSHNVTELECSVIGCDKAAQEGAHLEDPEGEIPPTYLVVPICSECHQPSKLSDTRMSCVIKDRTSCIEDTRDWTPSIRDEYGRLFQCPKCEEGEKEWLWKKSDGSGYCFVCENHFQEDEMHDEEDIE
jgi:hypothetical protein